MAKKPNKLGRIEADPKQPKTIKISTVVVSVVVALAIIGAFIGGWTAKGVDEARVKAQAQELVKSLESK